VSSEFAGSQPRRDAARVVMHAHLRNPCTCSQSCICTGRRTCRQGLMFGRSAQPTRHLLIGNVGPGVGQQHDAIAAVLAPLGCVNVHVPQLSDKAACYVFASFETDSTAAAALAAVHAQPCSALGGRVLTAKYAAEKRRSRVGAGVGPA
jgi:hypothetical protein